MSTLEQGYASAKAVTRTHAKSFFFASMVLFGERRRAAFALYAFCRRLDDAIDNAPQEQLDTRARLLEDTRRLVHALFDSGECLCLPGFPDAELRALHDTCTRFQIPKRPFLELIDGMEMDLRQSHYASWQELDLYCYRVAGVVGLMMAPLLGTTDPTALRHAADLGRAMQLTNILRDVREDLARGRLYLPTDDLVRCNVTEADLSAGVVTPAVAALFELQIHRARELYRSAMLGVPFLRGFGSQRLVRLMSALYGGILGVIERRGFDVFSSRASVSRAAKLGHLLKVLVTPNPRAALPSSTRASAEELAP